MKIKDFDYDLPPDYIAQTPIEPRDSSRLLVLRRDNGEIEHCYFRQIGHFIHPGDLFVVNKTRVFPARIFAQKPSGGRVEILLLRRTELRTWDCLVGGKGLSIGKELLIVDYDNSGRNVGNFPNLIPQMNPGEVLGLRARIIEELEGSHRRIQFSQPIEPFFSKVGHVPLPPYIHKSLDNPERYQTVFAKEPGSAAAPTAGLHFTHALMNQLITAGAAFAEVTLHVGLDTFAPVTEENPEEHQIHSEWCEIPPETVEAIAKARHIGGRIIAVGTTTVRTLESAAQLGKNTLISYSGLTNLFIFPGYKFRIVDAIVTNFHLPKSTS